MKPSTSSTITIDTRTVRKIVMRSGAVGAVVAPASVFSETRCHRSPRSDADDEVALPALAASALPGASDSGRPPARAAGSAGRAATRSKTAGAAEELLTGGRSRDGGVGGSKGRAGAVGVRGMAADAWVAWVSGPLLMGAEALDPESAVAGTGGVSTDGSSGGARGSGGGATGTS